MSTLDLEHGEPEEESPSQRRRRQRRADEAGKKERPKPTEKDDRSLVGRLDTTFTKIADQMEARGDDELATAIKDERHAMSQGLVSLTSSVTFLRPLLTLVLALVEPVVAFYRVGRILVMRYLVWRANRPAPMPPEAQPEPTGIVVG